LGATCLSLCAAALHLSGVQIIFNNVNWAMAKAMVASAAWFAGLPGANFHFKPDAALTNAPAIWRVLELPHGAAANHLRLGDRHWLFDVGDETSFRRVLRPYLHSSGINAVTGVFLSHNDADHVGGVEKVIAEFDRPRLFCSTQEPGAQDSALTTLRRLADSTSDGMLRRLRVDERLTLSDDPRFKAEARVLYPSRQVQNARGDDRAMVVMLHLGPWRVLWLSDAGWNAEKALSSGPADLRCDVLIRSQHELDREMSVEFLLKAAPRVIVCGSDARQPEVQLPDSLVQFARRQNIPLLDTWSDGSIELRLNQDDLRIHPAKTKPQVILTPCE
ncbi:MAG: MBL fold metallo-hydrolase, partial [Prosthecobacter sp.]|nr:MBL fold metallo-hydrolase [Prosthecobacter sp.]